MDILPVDDWFSDGEELRPRSIAVWNDMDRLSKGILDSVRDPALFEVIVHADPSRKLTAVVLHADRVGRASPVARIHVLAVTGMRLER